MKLLYLAHRIPYPPDKGDKIRSYHELRALVDCGHEVHLLAFAGGIDDQEHETELARHCASVRIIRLRRSESLLRTAWSLVTNEALSTGYFHSGEMARAVRGVTASHDFDAVFVYSGVMAQYVPDHLASRTVVDLVDVDSEKWLDYSSVVKWPRSWLYRLESARLRKFEAGVILKFAQTFLATRREAALLEKNLDEFSRRAKVRLMTNGVDLEFFDAGNEPSREKLRHLVFVGAMDYFANIDGVKWFVDDVLPMVRLRKPEVVFQIVGSNPARAIRKLAQSAGIEVTGYVADVRPYLRKAAVCVVPLRVARGVQNKVLESMACGRPVVATPESVAGLDLTDGQELIVAGSPERFAESVIGIMEDAALSETLSLSARNFVEQRHAWKPLLQGMVEVVESVARRRTRSGSDLSNENTRKANR